MKTLQIQKSDSNYYDTFLDFLEKRNYARNTIESYTDDLSLLSQYLPDGISTGGEAERFIDFLYNRGNAPSSIRRTVSTCKSFYNFLVKVGTLDNNPFDDVTLPRESVFLPRVATKDNVSAILAAISGDDFLPRRDRAIIALLAGTGARISEIIHCRLSNIDKDRREIRVIAKGNIERVLVCTKESLDTLEDYLAVRGTIVTPEYRDILFFTINGDPLTYRAACWAIGKYCKKVGINLTAHSFRHGFLTAILDATNNIRICQELAGHKDIKTTARYTLVSKNALHKAVNDTFGE